MGITGLVRSAASYNVEGSQTEEAPWVCSRCGYATHVMSVGSAKAGANLLDDDHAAAEQSAQRGAMKDARRLMAIARCPSCRRAPIKARIVLFGSGLLIGTGIGALLCGPMLLAGAPVAFSIEAWAIVAFGIAVPRWCIHVVRARSRVIFDVAATDSAPAP